MTATPATPKPRRKSVGRARFGLPPSSLHSPAAAPAAAPVWTYPTWHNYYTRKEEPVFCDHPVYQDGGPDSAYARATLDEYQRVSRLIENKHGVSGYTGTLYDEDGDPVYPYEGDVPESVTLDTLDIAADDIERKTKGKTSQVANGLRAYVAKRRKKHDDEQAECRASAARLLQAYITETRRTPPEGNTP